MLWVIISQSAPGYFGKRLNGAFLWVSDIVHVLSCKISLKKRRSQTATRALFKYISWQFFIFFFSEGIPRDRLRGCNKVVFHISHKCDIESQETLQSWQVMRRSRSCGLFRCESWPLWMSNKVEESLKVKASWLFDMERKRSQEDEWKESQAGGWSLQQHCGSIHHQGMNEFVSGQEKDVGVIETWGDESLDKNLTAGLEVRGASEIC